jgi:beta-lactamase regulating signal transducer with metallopeptidase domain
MTDTLRLLDHPLVATLGWTLTHFVWQGALLGLAAFVFLRVMRPERAATRYLIAAGTLAAMLVVPVLTFVTSSGETASTRVAWQPQRSPVTANAGAVTGSMIANFEQNPAAVRQWLPTQGSPASASDAAAIAPWWLPLVTAIWMLGVSVLSIRLLGGWALTQLLARRAVAQVSNDVEASAREMARRLGLRRSFAVVQSSAVLVPTLVGWVKPVVLLPMSALAGLSPEQLQAVIAHELAHIRRHDYLVNLLQSVVETLLFYHPAVWWVSAEIRAEREHCCDDLAVEVCGDRLVYVSALAELTSIERRAFALAATDGSLVTRVRRLLGRPLDSRRELPPSWAILVLLVLVGGGAGTYEMSADAAAVERIAHAAAASASAPSELRDRSASAPDDSDLDAQQPAPVVPIVPAAPVAPPAPPVPVAPVGVVVAPVPVGVFGLIAPPFPPAPLVPVAPVAPVPVAPAVPVAPSMPVAAPVMVPPVPVGVFGFVGPEVPPTPPVAPAAPVAPVAPALPVAPVPPPAAMTQGQRGEGNFVWNDNGERLTVRWTGPFRLSDDERDVAWIEEGARLTIADGWVFTDRIEMRGLAGGVDRKFYRSGLEREFDNEARGFLVNSIQRMIRSGMFAAERVARLLKQGGPDAVLAEMDRLQTNSSYVKRVYYLELVRRADLNVAQLTRVVERVGKDITSDHEKATVLLEVLQEGGVTDEQRAIAIRAAKTLRSDFERRRVLTAAMPSGTLSTELTLAVIDAVEQMNSSHERSQVLLTVAKRGGVTPQTSGRFMAAVSSMASAHEQRQVLSAVAAAPSLAEGVALDAVKAAGTINSPHEKRQAVSAYVNRSDASPKVAAAAMASAATINSSHEKAQVLLQVIAKGGLTDATAQSFFDTVNTMSSAHDMATVLKAVVAKGPLTERLLTGVLDSAKKINSSFERAQLLMSVLKTHTVTGANRSLFLDAAEGISSAHEQNQVLAALVRAERR